MTALIAAQLDARYGVSRMPRRPALIACVGVLALAGAARAQPVATAGARGDELSTAQQIDAWTHDGAAAAQPPTPRAAHGDVPVDSPWAEGLAPTLPLLPYDAPPIARTLVDGRIHGEAGAEYGNRGYGGYATASGPLGQNGAVQVGVSDFRGTGGRSSGGWNGDHKSLSVGAVFDFSRDRKPPADSDAPSY